MVSCGLPRIFHSVHGTLCFQTVGCDQCVFSVCVCVCVCVLSVCVCLVCVCLVCLVCVCVVDNGVRVFVNDDGAVAWTTPDKLGGLEKHMSK